MVRLELLPEAEQDVTAAFRWYEEQVVGLRVEFIQAADQLIERIQENPRLYPRVHRTLHRGLLPRFPYGAFYLFQQEQVVVVAVLHTAQHPERWRARLGQRR